MKNTVDHPPYIGVLLLAAGASRRMGTPKQLLKIGQQTLIEKTINIAIGLKQQKTAVVLGAHAEKIKELLSSQSGFSVLINKYWQQGMGTSLQTGVKFFLKMETPPEAILIMVCDQPYLSLAILDQLVETYQKTKADIIAAQYDEIIGVPALFSKKVFAKLSQLDKDEGARKIIKNHKGSIVTVHFPKGKIDLDTPEAYQAFLKECG